MHTPSKVFLIFAVAAHVASHYLMRYMARPLIGPSGELLEAGADLTDSYITEYAMEDI